MFAPSSLCEFRNCPSLVHHQVDVKAGGQIRVDVVEKPQELLMPMAPAGIAYRYAAGYIQGCGQ